MKAFGKSRVTGGEVRRAIASLLVALLATPFLRADTVVTTGVSSGVVQKTDPFRVITASSPTPGAITIASGATAIFRSGNTVSLQPGFRATQGSFFHAAISTSASVPLAWPAYETATSYSIYRNGALLNPPGSAFTGTSYLDTSAVAGTAYTYVIKANIPGGEATVLTISGSTTSGFQVYSPLLQLPTP